jgi:hypothetical protein
MIFLVLYKLELTNYILKPTNLFILMVGFYLHVPVCTIIIFSNWELIVSLFWHGIVTNSFR